MAPYSSESIHVHLVIQAQNLENIHSLGRNLTLPTGAHFASLVGLLPKGRRLQEHFVDPEASESKPEAW